MQTVDSSVREGKSANNGKERSKTPSGESQSCLCIFSTPCLRIGGKMTIQNGWVGGKEKKSQSCDVTRASHPAYCWFTELDSNADSEKFANPGTKKGKTAVVMGSDEQVKGVAGRLQMMTPQVWSLDEMQEEREQRKVKLKPSMAGANREKILAWKQRKMGPTVPWVSDALVQKREATEQENNLFPRVTTLASWRRTRTLVTKNKTEIKPPTCLSFSLLPSSQIW